MSESVRLYGINKLRETLVVAEATRRSMQGNTSRDTKPEVALRLRLWHSGLRGYRKNVRRLPGTPDIVYGPSRVAVFVHGCFWHGHDCGKGRIPRQNRAFWEAKITRNQERHTASVTSLEAQGYRVVTVWECEQKTCPDLVEQRIRLLVEAPL